MLYKITNGSAELGGQTILENIDFEIRDREKIAIVGRNGAGKTTLLKCITGEIEMGEGCGDERFTVTKAGDPVIGYMKQASFEDDSVSLLDEVLTVFRPLIELERKMQLQLEEIDKDPDEKKAAAYSAMHDMYEAAGGYTYKKEYLTMIRKFGFSDEDLAKPVGEFSGGQRTRIAFMKLLLSHPDILLLDEPTNHLDISAVRWLERYIKSYRSSVVIVSHDRMFIEKTVDRVCEIEYGEVISYKGNYSSFERQKRENYERRLKDYEYRQKEIKRLTALVERFRYKAHKAAMAQSKLKQIERLKAVDAPDRFDLRKFHANITPRIETVKDVLKVSDLTIGYDHPIATVNFALERGQKLGIIGDNGTGKSTLVKTLMNEIPKLDGNFEFGLHSEIGYFNQQMAQYDSGKTVIDDFWDEFPHLTETDVRTSLGSFLFSGDDVFKEVGSLSGGERVALALCKILRRRPNILILDEPTNHMDILGKETLENMLCSYEGTLIVVSHDRYLINKVADRLLVFSEAGAAFYPLTYEEYEEREAAREAEVKETRENRSGGKKSFTTPLKEIRKKERRLSRIEELMDKNRAEAEELTASMSEEDVYTDYVRVAEIQERMEELDSEYEELSGEWLLISEELEQKTENI